jgi:hypothetical protein
LDSECLRISVERFNHQTFGEVPLLSERDEFIKLIGNCRPKDVPYARPGKTGEKMQKLVPLCHGINAHTFGTFKDVVDQYNVRMPFC